MPLPDIVATKSEAKTKTPVIKWSVTSKSFLDENKKKIEINPAILLDMNNIKSGFKLFMGSGQSPERVDDTWENGNCKPTAQPPAKDVGGELKRWQRFVEIPSYNSKLGTRLFSFDSVSAYKSAQSLVSQWEENRSNQAGTVFHFKLDGIETKPTESDPTRNYVYPKFTFSQEINRPEEFEDLAVKQTEEKTEDVKTNDLPF